MYRCELCNTILQERYKTKHNQSKKHKCYSILIINRYDIKDFEVTRFNDLFNPYFIKHTKKFNFFLIYISLRLSDLLHQKINISNYVTYKIQIESCTTYTTELANDFFHKVISSYLSNECATKIIPELEIVFISDPKDITR